MENFRHGGDGGFTAAAARALLDRDRWRNADDAVKVRSRRRLNHGAGVRVEAFKVTALAFGKSNAESERGFAGARHPGNRREFSFGKDDVDPLQVVFSGTENSEVAFSCFAPDALQAAARRLLLAFDCGERFGEPALHAAFRIRKRFSVGV